MMWIQISTAIIFGLAFSKLITLGLIPAMLALPYRVREHHGSFLRMYGHWFAVAGRFIANPFGWRHRRHGY
jgi:multidrug efflux pump